MHHAAGRSASIRRIHNLILALAIVFRLAA
jgi:hypothetical protein